MTTPTGSLQSSATVDPAVLAGSRPELAPIKKVSIICSKGSLDMAYPGLILANAARMSGIDVTMFFTFWGLDIVTQKKIDRLHVSPVGNPSRGCRPSSAGCRGWSSPRTR